MSRFNPAVSYNRYNEDDFLQKFRIMEGEQCTLGGLQFYNPDRMPKPIEELKGKDISLPRSPVITKLFRVVKLAENAGYGLDNIEYKWNRYKSYNPLA